MDLEIVLAIVVTLLVVLFSRALLNNKQVKDNYETLKQKWEIERLRSKIDAYTTCSTLDEKDWIPKDPPSRLVIGLFGATGVGKSSLINSILQLFSHGKHRAPVGAQDIMRGHTLCRGFYDVTRAIRIVDNRGMDNMDDEHTNEELSAQIDGKRGHTHKVDNDSKEEGRDIKGDPVHIGVYVVRNDAPPTNYRNTMAIVETCQTASGRTPYAIITHKDCAADFELDNRQVLSQVGIDEDDVFSVENTHGKKKDLEPDTQIALLKFLERCTINGDHSIIFRLKKITEEAELKANKEMVDAKKSEDAQLREEREKKKQMREERNQKLQNEKIENERKHDLNKLRIEKDYELKNREIELQIKQQELEIAKKKKKKIFFQ